MASAKFGLDFMVSLGWTQVGLASAECGPLSANLSRFDQVSWEWPQVSSGSFHGRSNSGVARERTKVSSEARPELRREMGAQGLALDDHRCYTPNLTQRPSKVWSYNKSDIRHTPQQHQVGHVLNTVCSCRERREFLRWTTGGST